LWLTKASHDFDLLNWMAGGQPVRVFATANLSYYKPLPDAAGYCRICSRKEYCPDFYDIECPEAPLWDKLAAISEEATGHKRDTCLYNSDKDTFDNGMAVVEYDNDIRATYTLNVVSARSTRQMRISGTEGAAEADMEEGILTVYPRHNQHKIIHDLKGAMQSSHGGADDRILMDFFHCCRTGDKPRSSWADGRLSVQVGLAARDSIDTGNPITLLHTL
jgi:predicted dehydrogenase